MAFCRLVAVAVCAVWVGLLAGTAYAASFTAKTVVTVDAHSGQVVEDQSGDVPVGPASLAKMMTLYLIYTSVSQGQVAWDDQVMISHKAFRKEGSTMFLRERSRVSLKDLTYGIGVVSGNDACIAVAEHLAGSEDAFVEWMNEIAERIGMAGTHFGSATGLPAPGQVTTGRDMAILAQRLLGDFPEVLEVLSTRHFSHEGVKQPNRNRLLWKDIGVDGMKTGHTQEDGYHLVASSEKGNQRFIVAVMGADSENSREEIAQRYLMTAYRKFATVAPLLAGESAARVVVWKGAENMVDAVPDNPGYVTVPREQEDTVSVAVTVSEVEAPVKQGQLLGVAQVYVGTDMVREVRLVAARDVDEAGLFKRLWHTFLLMFRDLLDKLF
jgi:D-alanyl-D-alanine carboxypeptidase (penicillin-binding protein 5/6)